MWGYGLNRDGYQVAGTCECGNEPSGLHEIVIVIIIIIIILIITNCN
jgi:hypothetical protein